MFKAIRRAAKRWQRRRRLNEIRREFAQCGYPLDHLKDAEVEVVVTDGAYRIEEARLSAKMMYFALRRLAAKSGVEHFHKRRTGTAAQSA